MPSRTKLLNGAGASTTGLSSKRGTAKPPYVIRIIGTGMSLGGGGAGTKGVNIETSPDNGVTWQRDFGQIGGENATETNAGELVDLPDKTIAFIEHHVRHIRATTGSGMVGTVTVTVEEDT